MIKNMSQKNTSLQGKRILIFQQRNWAINTGHILAKKFQAEGCRLAAFTLKKTTHEYILSQKEVKYELIISNDEIMGKPKDYLAGDKFSLAAICDDLGVASIWPLVATLRNHARSYKDKYYYSFKQNVPDEEIIDYIMAVYKCVKIMFDQFNPEVIISPNFVSFPHIMFNLYAERKGVKMISVTDCKVEGIYIFTFGYRDDRGPFYERVDALNQGRTDSPNRAKARRYIREFREKFKNPDYSVKHRQKKSLKEIVKDQLRPYYQIYQWYTTKQINVLPSTGITYDYRPPRIILRDHYCHLQYKRQTEKFNFYPFSKINQYVYYPLQFQPEANVDAVAPYFSNQIETARQIAMSLPDDYTLVVKEHPEMVGLRPPSYLEKVARTVNVKLIDYRLPSEQVLKKCALLICPNSTTLTEAAFYHKPAIQLGDLGTTLKLPNVFKHTDMTTLSVKIKEILAVNLKTAEYERRLENYVAAAYDTGFKYDFEGAWGGRTEESFDNMWQMLKKELV